jgi:hypothetical protein
MTHTPLLNSPRHTVVHPLLAEVLDRQLPILNLLQTTKFPKRCSTEETEQP